MVQFVQQHNKYIYKSTIEKHNQKKLFLLEHNKWS